MKAEPASTTMTHVGEPAAGEGGARAAVLYLLLEAERPLARSARHVLAEVDEVVIGRAADRAVARTATPSGRTLTLGVPDRWLSGRHARLTRVLGRWLLEDLGSKNGTQRGGTPITRAELGDGDVIEIGHTFFVFRDAVPSVGDLPSDLDAAALAEPRPGLRTLLPALAAEHARLGEIARSTVSVLLQGESGTGKEVAARAIHRLSGRAGTFVAVNCGALPQSLVGSELFGHRKGAFSGATEERAGFVRSSDRGTLFLDEIGDLPLEVQPALLRVLQEREVVAVGAERPVKVDLRVVAATHRDLPPRVEAGAFRADLLARLSGFTLALPPLRERLEDLGLIVGDVLETLLGPRAAEVRFTVDAARALLAHRWPLNVRELEKCLDAAVVLAGAGPPRLEHLPEAVRDAGAVPAAAVADAPVAGASAPEEATARPLTAAESQHREQLVALLREHHGNVSSLARTLGKARMQIQRWLKRYGLDPEAYRQG